MAVMLIIAMAILGPCGFLTEVIASSLDGPLAKEVKPYIYIAFSLVGVHLARRKCISLCELPKQLENFKVRESNCFCCSNNHMDPRTKRKIPCDRKLVYNTLARWFAESELDPAKREEKALDEFDEHIKTTVGRAITQKKDIH